MAGLGLVDERLETSPVPRWGGNRIRPLFVTGFARGGDAFRMDHHGRRGFDPVPRSRIGEGCKTNETEAGLLVTVQVRDGTLAASACVTGHAQALCHGLFSKSDQGDR